jgi:hypothetical protein
MKVLSLLPAVLQVVKLLPKVAPTLRKLKDIVTGNKEPENVTKALLEDTIINSFDDIKHNVKLLTASLLTFRTVAETTPNTTDDEVYNSSIDILTEIRDNITAVIEKCPKI